MANTFQTIGMVTRELLMLLKNNCAHVKGFSREWEPKFAVSGAKINAELRIRVTPKYIVQAGPGFVAQNYDEEYVTLRIDKQRHVDVEFSSIENTLQMDDWTKRVGRPSAVRLANEVDKDALLLYKDVANSVVSPTTPATKFYQYNMALAVLLQSGAPMDDDFTITVEPMENAAVVNANLGLFQSSDELRFQYERGKMRTMAGFSWQIDQNVAVHTTGARAGGATAIVTVVGQTGSSILTSGWTASSAVLNEGDVLQFTGVMAANPQTLASTGRLRDFVVTAPVVSDGSGLATIPIYPPIIIPPDPRATVTSAPAASAPLLFTGAANTTYHQNIACHKEAFTVALVPLVAPESGRFSRASDPENGMSIRVWKDSNIETDMHPSRADILYGMLAQHPSLACRIWSVPGIS